MTQTQPACPSLVTNPKESTQGGGWPTTPLRFAPYAKGPKDPLSDFPFLSL